MGVEWADKPQVEVNERGWPILRSAQDMVCEGKNPTTGQACTLGQHKGHHRDMTGAEWLDE